MIIDWQKNADHASLYDVLDATTGESLNGRAICYADDDKGFYRVYKMVDGKAFVDPQNPLKLASEEFAADIRIRLKPGYPSEAEGLRIVREQRTALMLQLERKQTEADIGRIPCVIEATATRDEPPFSITVNQLDRHSFGRVLRAIQREVEGCY